MRSLFLKVGLNILIMLVLTVLGTLYYQAESWILLSATVISILLIFIPIFSAYNKVNSKVSYFIAAIKNNDTTLVFPETKGTEGERELHRSLNKLNAMLHKSRKDSEVKEHYFKAIINQSSTGLIVRQSSTKISLANNAILEMSKLPTLYHIAQLDRVSSRFQHIIATIEPDEEVLESISVYGVKQHLSIQASELIDQQKRYVLISVRNLQTELDRNELDSWIKLIRVLTHEIMNSLAPISSVSQTLTEIYGKSGVDRTTIDESTIALTQKGVELIHEQSVGLTNFVNNYRSLTRIPEPDFEKVEVNSLILKWGEIASEIAPDSIQILPEITSNPIWVYTDVQMLNRVVSNLLKNGVEAVKGCSDPYLKIRFSKSLEFEIINNGPEIKEEVLENIWVPFFTTKEHGSGIGLSLCKQIIKRLNGYIGVVTSETETIFTLRL